MIGLHQHSVVTSEGKFAASSKAESIDRGDEDLRLASNQSTHLFIEVEIGQTSKECLSRVGPQTQRCQKYFRNEEQSG